MKTSRVLNTEILFQLFVKFIKPELICDIGTMDASHSILLRKISSSARIIAFEANPYNYQDIINKGIPESYNIEIIHKAVTNNSGQLVFQVQKYSNSSEDSWKAGTSSILQRNQNVGDTEEVEVESTRLDDFLTKTQNSSSSIALWIDVEGAGYEVLEGIKAVAKDITFLQIEVETKEVWKDQKLKADVQKLLSNSGLVEVGRGKHDEQHDLVFLNRRYLEDNSTKCNTLVTLAIIFYYIRKYGGHILSNILLIPILGIWRNN